MRKVLTKEQKTFKALAATGKYVSTGKVLIGLTHKRELPQMGTEAERLQSILLGTYRPFFSPRFVLYAVVLTVLFAFLVAACRS